MPAAILFLALRRQPARPVASSPSGWRGAEEERRGAGAALGTLAEASGMASAALRRLRRAVARGGPAARGSPGRRPWQWSAPSRSDPDVRRRPPMLILLFAASSSLWRRREELSEGTSMASFVLPSPAPPSAAQEKAAISLTRPTRGVMANASDGRGTDVVVRVAAVARSSSGKRMPQLSPPSSLVSLTMLTSDPTTPSATATHWTRGREPTSFGGGGQERGITGV